MTSDRRPKGLDGAAIRRAPLSQAGLAFKEKLSSVLAIRLASSSSRAGGLNRCFGQLVAHFGELGTPIGDSPWVTGKPET